MLLYILSKNKLTETFLFMNTFVFVVCFNSFPSIQFLIFVGKLPFAMSAVSRQPTHHTTLPYRLSSIFSTFFNVF